ncbi:MAG: hypothetical protein ACLTPC_18915 [Lacrimispora saccharolytica]
MNSKTKRANNQVNSVMNIQEQREMVEKANRILSEMRSFTWRDLETQGKFSKNEKLSFISDDMLIVGCDIGSETHYVRAIDTRGRELSKKALAFENDAEGFQKYRDWAVQLAAANDKKQIVLGLEPTGTLLVLPCGMDDLKRDQRSPGKPLRRETDEGTGG